MQQQILNLREQHLREMKYILKELKDLRSEIKYIKPPKSAIIHVHTFSDASFNISITQSYGQTGFISGIQFSNGEDDTIYYLVDWSSNKQRRISHSSYGAEILACTDGDDRG